MIFVRCKAFQKIFIIIQFFHSVCYLKGMNIYHPYEVLADNDDCLHLKETETRERIHFVAHRVLPIFLLFFMWFFIQQVGSEIPMGWDYIIVGATFVIAGILFFRTYITEIKITAGNIFLVKKTVNGEKQINIPVEEVDKITYSRKRGKTRGAFFTLHTRGGTSFLILSIPPVYIDQHHIKLLRERLQDMLHTEVV